MTDLVECDLEKRRQCPGWNPWQNVQPFDGSDTAMEIVERMCKGECWDIDDTDKARMAGMIAPYLQGAYEQGRWEQGCIEQDRTASRVDELESCLRDIAEIAHDASTGPAIPDTLWEIRGIAYEVL